MILVSLFQLFIMRALCQTAPLIGETLVLSQNDHSSKNQTIQNRYRFLHRSSLHVTEFNPAAPVALSIRGNPAALQKFILEGVDLTDPLHPGGGTAASSDLFMGDLWIEENANPYRTGGTGSIISSEIPWTGSFIEGASGSGDQKLLKGAIESQAGRLKLQMGATHHSQKAISQSDAGNNADLDGFESLSGHVKIRGEWSPWLKSETFILRSTSRSDLDAFGGIGGDDPNSSVHSDALVLKQGLSLKDTSILLGHTQFVRNYNNPPDPTQPFSEKNRYGSQTFQGKVEQAIRFGNASFQPGLEWQEHAIDTTILRKKETLLVPKGLIRYGYPKIFWTEIAVRLESSEFGLSPSGQLALGMGSFYFKSSASQERPSLFQRYSQFGNALLQKQDSLSQEIGFEKNLLKICLFQNDFFKRIDLQTKGGSSQYENIGRTRVRGLSISQELVWKWLHGGIEATTLHPRSLDKNEDLLRQPRYKASSNVGVNWFKNKISNELYFSWIGKRSDRDFRTSRLVTLPSYSKIDMLHSYAFIDGSITRAEVYAEIQNVFNRKFQEILGYSTSGLSGLVGIRAYL